MSTVDRQHAVEAFEAAIDERAATYESVGEVVEQLRATEATLTADYLSYIAIASTLTDGTVMNPAARTNLLSAVTEYAKTDLALDGAGAFVADRPPLYDVLVLEQLVLAEPAPVSEFSTEELKAQSAVLVEDTKLTRAYIELVQDVTARITAAAVTVSSSADAALASAAEKGVTLSWEKALAETATVVAAAGALAPANTAGLSLADRAAAVSAYVTSVNAATAAHQAVLDQEAEAARRAAAEAARHAAAQQQRSMSSGSKANSSPRGTSGGQPNRNTNGSSGTIPQGGGRPGGGTNGTNGGCWTSNGAGGTMPCGGW